uniref:Uncharacterized protein n=1 Tax=Cucumis sativus TaxID=3659 RepID=A0A0A0LPI9_CUCSA
MLLLRPFFSIQRPSFGSRKPSVKPHVPFAHKSVSCRTPLSVPSRSQPPSRSLDWNRWFIAALICLRLRSFAAAAPVADVSQSRHHTMLSRFLIRLTQINFPSRLTAAHRGVPLLHSLSADREAATACSLFQSTCVDSTFSKLQFLPYHDDYWVLVNINIIAF